MQEVAIVTTSKDAGGIGIYDVATATPICPNFKSCIADTGAMCVVGGLNAYSGMSIRTGDYLCVAQSKKPLINLYQWNKPQVHQQFHTQEVITALIADPTGTFLIAGGKKGWLYAWNISTGSLFISWQAHFKEIVRLVYSSSGDFCFSSSGDGMIKAWDLGRIFDDSEGFSGLDRRAITPFRSWSPHSLPVTDMALLGASPQTLRVLSCSLDRAVVLFDVFSNRQVFRLGLPEALESICINGAENFAFAGSSSGLIFSVDICIAFLGGISTIPADRLGGSLTGGITAVDRVLPVGVSALSGHIKAVVSLKCSLDNSTFVSVSADGSMRWWDVLSCQCIREVKPFNKVGISNILMTLKPEVLALGSHNPTLAPFEFLQKFPDRATEGRELSNTECSGSRLWGWIQTSGTKRKLNTDLFERYLDADTKVRWSTTALSEKAISSKKLAFLSSNSVQDEEEQLPTTGSEDAAVV